MERDALNLFFTLKGRNKCSQPDQLILFRPFRARFSFNRDPGASLRLPLATICHAFSVKRKGQTGMSF